MKPTPLAFNSYYDGVEQAKLLTLLGSELSTNLSPKKLAAPSDPEPEPKQVRKPSPSVADGPKPSILANTTTVLYNNCNMYSSGTMNFGLALPPPPQLQLPPLLTTRPSSNCC